MYTNALEQEIAILKQQLAESTREFTVTVARLEQEIHKRKQVEQELRQSQQFLQQIFDMLPQRIFWKDRNLRYLGCNKSFAQDAGLDSPVDIIGKDDFELVWREFAHNYQADDQAVITSSVAKLHYEELLIKEDGTKIWIKTSKVPLCNEVGEIIGVFGCYEDITTRKAAETALKESQQQLQAFIDNSPSVIFIKDVEGRYILANRNFWSLD
ncbi:hypothetical protein CEN44_19475 [Fischerella muscicola CCMEE 5323]|uniref:PAC domain-containing protein n=2 Tax=Fischerella muscicola TaxID=92938 RepID=A0A2N6JZC8_FISMU|nr:MULTISPECIES: PAS domain-containing protein [Fischerella]MBD2432963.1 PAS domain-containing protein [Fischerella sp. FACHB-380]PLZ86697.1 hypothetical protein CEN44_19475 [Fischerella muscicola CCMEE 5323]